MGGPDTCEGIMRGKGGRKKVEKRLVRKKRIPEVRKKGSQKRPKVFRSL